MPTLPCKLPHAKHAKCNTFSSVDRVALKRACCCGRVALKKLIGYTDVHAQSRALHDQRLDVVVDDTLQNASQCINDHTLSSLCWKTPAQTAAHCTPLTKTSSSALKTKFTQRSHARYNRDVENVPFPSFHFGAK